MVEGLFVDSRLGQIWMLSAFARSRDHVLHLCKEGGMVYHGCEPQ